MTDPGVGVQSSSEPIVIFPMRKTFLPDSRLPLLSGSAQLLTAGRAGSETKITRATSGGAVMCGCGLHGGLAARAAVVARRVGTKTAYWPWQIGWATQLARHVTFPAAVDGGSALGEGPPGLVRGVCIQRPKAWFLAISVRVSRGMRASTLRRPR
jgi:hypothetical protein